MAIKNQHKINLITDVFAVYTARNLKLAFHAYSFSTWEKNVQFWCLFTPLLITAVRKMLEHIMKLIIVLFDR